MLDGSVQEVPDVRVEPASVRPSEIQPSYDNRLTLQDGRMLGYAEFGDPAGHPVIYCHGFPASRFEAGLAHRAAIDANIRLLSFDRPGYGISDHKPDRTLLDWASDMEDVADYLGFERFSVIGVSGGAPYALACAYALPHRLASTAIVCGLAPTHEAKSRHDMMWTLRTGLFLGRKAPRLLKWIYAGIISPLPRWQPKGATWLLNLTHAGADRDSLRYTDLKVTLAQSVREAFRQGPAAAIRDVELYARDWGFDLTAIDTRVDLWHGEEDPTLPVSMGRSLAAMLPSCRAHFVVGEGHFSLPINYASEILRVLVA